MTFNTDLKPVISLPASAEECITLAHGSGGKAMRDLIEDVVLGSFANPLLSPLEDQARIDLASLTARGDRLAFTTDSFVVDPIEFPGGDIGTLAVNGTVNDLAMSGARPLYLTCSFILEEGLPVSTLRRIARSMRKEADAAGVSIVTGDTKVVPRGAADKLFINTSGIGVIPSRVDIRAERATPGDVIIINGLIGDHGATILNARGDLALDTPIESDCQSLVEQVEALRVACPDIHCMRDATRGGVATVLNEFAESSGVKIRLHEVTLPVRNEVRGMCEILGLDPLYLANEGKFVAIIPAGYADAALVALHASPNGEHARVIGEVVATTARPQVVMATAFGSERLIDMLVGDQLPRIC
ncbi:MAG: hydrogenase expression/formation protein HypE [Amphritea sp.]